MNAYLCGSCGQGVRHIDGRCCTCGGPFSPRRSCPNCGRSHVSEPGYACKVCGSPGTETDPDEPTYSGRGVRHGSVSR